MVKPPSAINLKDHRLEASGFMTGMPITINITITVERGRLIIETEINL
ncbi:SymE family type I addiction module toxin [Lonsdalea quercina]